MSYDDVITAAAQKYGVDPARLLAIAQQESSGNPNAVNADTGAAGLFQFIPATAKAYGIDPRDPAQAADAAARMYAENLKRFGGDNDKATAAHFAGPDMRLWGPKTLQYVKGINARMGTTDQPVDESRLVASDQPVDESRLVAKGPTVQDAKRAMVSREIATAATPFGMGPDIAFGARQAYDAVRQIIGHATGNGQASDQAANASLADYNKAYQPQLFPGSGVARGAGQALVTAPLAMIGGSGGPLLSAVQGAASGAGASLLTPVYGDTSNFGAQKLAEAKRGAVVGGALGGGLGLANKVLGPTADARALMDEGITPNIGQMAGGFLKTLEEKASSIPVLGDIIKSGQASGLQDFNRALYNRALAPIGEKYSGPVGQEGLGYVRDRLSNAYDSVLSKLGPTQVDDQFKTGVTQVYSMLNGVPAAQQQFANLVKAKIVDRITPGNTLTPSILKQAESDLGQFVRDYIGQGGDSTVAARAVAQVQQGLRQMVQRSNPEYAQQLQAVNNGYAQLVQLQNAANSVKVAGNEGILTPADYLKGIKAGDKSARDNVFSSGEALNQDIAQAANKVLSNKYPDSGTIGRGLTAAMASGAGGAMLHPALGVGALYLPFVRNAVAGASGLLSRAAQAAPYLAAPAVGLLGLQ